MTNRPISCQVWGHRGRQHLFPMETDWFPLEYMKLLLWFGDTIGFAWLVLQYFRRIISFHLSVAGLRNSPGNKKSERRVYTPEALVKSRLWAVHSDSCTKMIFKSRYKQEYILEHTFLTDLRPTSASWKFSTKSAEDRANLLGLVQTSQNPNFAHMHMYVNSC